MSYLEYLFVYVPELKQFSHLDLKGISISKSGLLHAQKREMYGTSLSGLAIFIIPY